MSERANKEVEVVPPPSLIKRLQLPLIIGGATLMLIVFMLIGLGIGVAKGSMDRKKFAEQTAQYKKQLEEIGSERTLFEVKSEALKKDLLKKKDQLEALEAKVDDLERGLRKAERASQADEHTALATPAPKPKEYVRFSNVDCTLTTGKGSNAWKECLKQGKTAGQAEKPKEVQPAKEEAKSAAPAPKPVDSHAKAAH